MARESTAPSAPALGDRSRRDLAATAGDIVSSRWLVLAIAALGAIVYLPTLRDWFSYDDFWFLRSGHDVSFWTYTRDALDFRKVGDYAEFDRYRPLYPIAFWLQYQAFGNDALGYRLVLIALHVASIVLVWAIARRITGLTWAANLAALIFAVHPAYAYAIGWIAGGNRVFIGGPYLLSFYLFIRYVDTKRWYDLSGAFLAFIVAVLMHSTALSLAAVLPAYMFLVAGEPRDATRPRAWLPLLPFFAVTGALFLIQWYVRGELEAESFRFGWHQYGNYGQYFGLALFPGERMPRPGDAGYWDTLLNGLEGIASVVVLLGCLVLVSQRKNWRLGVFAVWWFIVSFFLDSSLWGLGTSGRSMYMPGASIAVLFTVFVLWARDVTPPALARPFARVAPALILVALVPVCLLTVHEATMPRPQAEANERFVDELRAELPELEPGAHLYVVGPPGNLTIFGTNTRLDSLVDLYYDGVTATFVPPGQLDQVKASLRPQDRIFRYVP